MKTTCPECGAELPSDGGICPACLLKTGLGSQPEPNTLAITEADVRERRLPEPGEQFGGYRIVCALGRGGMGAVYEAEQLESGRRVALKVLSHQLDSADARKRFFREGRLAASINHPNSVYVYGTEEIDGTPAITMELIAGGTLQERVQQRGPLPVSEAADAILQIIAGLEAAQAIGILHRDIKPANCFVDVDGAVKVGDFGLSISTAARGESNVTLHGAFLGTPAFASPEQLRGDELNVRSDMYAVGVTLFYLLTGRTPFEGKNVVSLIANVLEQPAPSPKKFRAEVPEGLAKVVLRCLEKQPGERFKNYDELRQVLAPFSSEAPVAAPLGLRLIAGFADMALVTCIGMTVSLMVVNDLATYTNVNSYRSPKMLMMMGGSFLMMLMYFAVCDGLWGRTLGKALCRLRVAGLDQNPPGIAKAFLRAAMILILPPLPTWIAYSFNPMGFLNSGSMWASQSVGLSYYALLALLFCTARRRNGFAAVHDLLTNTRVIRKPEHQARPVLAASEEAPPVTETKPKVGPFHVIETLEKTDDGEWLLGYDTRLLRKVWIRTIAPGTPPITPFLRNLGRIGRLRWITGRRSPQENWDAYEGITGRPLVKLLEQRQPWSQVRFWLLDLAEEISAAQKDRSLPTVLALDRVWITADGRAKLLDFSMPGWSSRVSPDKLKLELQRPPVVAVDSTAQQFLAQVANAALTGHGEEAMAGKNFNTPLPLHARDFLDKLPTLPGAETIVAALKPLLRQVAIVSRRRRAGLIAGCLVFPVLAVIMSTLGLKILINWQRSEPDIMPLSQVLNYRTGMRWLKQTGPDDRTLGIYIASHFGRTITNATSWSSLYCVSSITGANRKFAEESVAAHPNPTEQEIKDANAAVQPKLPPDDMIKILGKPWLPLLIGSVSLLMYVALPALLCALLFRGGLVLRVTGVAVVRKDGARASRLRVLWRSMAAWSSVLLVVVLMAMLTPLIGWVAGAIVLGTLMIVLTGLSLSLPERSLQDRIAGTCLVPR